MALDIKLPPNPVPATYLGGYIQNVNWWAREVGAAIDLLAAGGAGISDAPSDGTTYGRKNAAWVAVLSDAPSDGSIYGRQNGAWAVTGGGLGDAPSDGTTYGRKNAAWVSTAPAAGDLTETVSSVLTISGGTGAVLGAGVTFQVKKASGSQAGYLASADWTTFNTKQSALKNSRAVVLCSGFTPTSLGPDAAEVEIPYATNGTSVTYAITAIRVRVGTAGGAPALTVEKSTGTGAFSAIAVGTVTLGSGANEGATTSSLGSINSGDKLRFNVSDLGSALSWTVIVEINAG
jgi:hypothetical protein